MSYSYDKFLRPITESDKSIKILDNTNDIKYTINPFIITNTSVNNNILRINLKSLKVILIDFSTSNEAKLALIIIQEQIDNLLQKVPNLIDKNVQNYVSDLIHQVSIVGPQGPTGIQGPTGSADRYTSTSSTIFEIPVLDQSVNLVTQPNLAYTAVQSIVVYSELPDFYDSDYQEDGAYFIAQIESYDSETGDMSLVTTFTYGTGTYDFWYLNLSGMVGVSSLVPFSIMNESDRNSIISPQIGTHIYQTDNQEGVYVYKSDGWHFAY
jgi:hypothetical protein